MDATLVRKLLDDLLAAAVASLAAPPERQLVGHGEHAYDCEMVAARLQTIRTETPELMRGIPGGPVIPVLTLRAIVLRCWPAVDEGGIPDASAITTAAQTLADDAVDLTGGLLARWGDGTLFPTAGIHADRVEVGVLEPIGPLGALAGWRVDLDVRT